MSLYCRHYTSTYVFLFSFVLLVFVLLLLPVSYLQWLNVSSSAAAMAQSRTGLRAKDGRRCRERWRAERRGGSTC